MKIRILTLFPDLVTGYFDHSLLSKAQQTNLFTLEVIDLRKYSTDKHNTVDDSPYGGGPGMVIKADVCLRALQDTSQEKSDTHRVILPTPDGKVFTQADAQRLSNQSEITILCGRYEGIDDRIRSHVTDTYSVGDYILLGGELPALSMTEAIVRCIPGVVGDADSVQEESFTAGRLDFPHFTRPPELDGHKVPEILQSGDHAAIARWRKKESLRRTFELRPDLFVSHPPDATEVALLSEVIRENLNSSNSTSEPGIL